MAVHGRRRVGKTYTIVNYFQKAKCTFFHSTGIRNGDFGIQIKQFTREIARVFYNAAPIQEQKNWYDTFGVLNQAMMEANSRAKIVLFFDELPWMATPKSDLISSLEFYWNRYWFNDPRICLIVCGSSASWIQENIIDNSEGLYNRVTRVLHMRPFNLRETREFLRYKKIKYPEKQIAEIYMALGGIPFYLDSLSSSLSVAENIDKLFFAENAPLLNEFDRLFASLFKSHELYESIVRTVSKHRYGVSMPQISAESKQSKGGSLNQRLKELEEAGFLEKFLPYQREERGHYFRLVDEFSIFYLQWVESYKRGLRRRDKADGFWLQSSKSPRWSAWSGYAFEALCYKHVYQIRKALNLQVDAVAGAWRHTPSKNSKDQGAQIDLLFDRSDDAISLCEMKFTKEPFSIDKSVYQDLKRKLDVFALQTKTEKVLFMVMVVTHGVKPNIYSKSLLDSVVTLKSLFVE